MSGANVSKPKLVATDLDGTLLRSDGTVSERTKQALRYLDRVGIPLVIVTGRPVRWMEDLWASIDGHGTAVLSNGALVFDIAAREIRATKPLDPTVIIEVASRLRERLPGTVFALEQTGGVGLEPEFHSRFDPHNRTAARDGTHLNIAPLEELLDGPQDATVLKLLAQHEDLVPEDFWAQIESAVGHFVTTTWSSTHALVEISAHGVTKASTLALLAADLGLGPEDVLAFGDMPNDIAMLEWAGLSYAMANAHPSALKAATHQARTNDDDGVARVLEAVFAIEPA